MRNETDERASEASKASNSRQARQECFAIRDLQDNANRSNMALTRWLYSSFNALVSHYEKRIHAYKHAYMRKKCNQLRERKGKGTKGNKPTGKKRCQGNLPGQERGNRKQETEKDVFSSLD